MAEAAVALVALVGAGMGAYLMSRYGLGTRYAKWIERIMDGRNRMCAGECGRKLAPSKFNGYALVCEDCVYVRLRVSDLMAKDGERVYREHGPKAAMEHLLEVDPENYARQARSELADLGVEW